MLSHRFEGVIQICSDFLHEEDLSQIRTEEPFHKKWVKNQFHFLAEVHIADLDLFDDIKKKKREREFDHHSFTSVGLAFILKMFFMERYFHEVLTDLSPLTER